MSVLVHTPSHEKIQDYEGSAGHPKSNINREIDEAPICGDFGEIPRATKGLRKMKNYRA
tara:strand:- start:877 stop:1053 length:177 start_codon:yes stop_codon:yes gene_type:complete